MNCNPFKVRYLPIFEQDLRDAAEYIAVVLGNKQAAERLVNDVEAAIQARLFMPDSYPVFKTSKSFAFPYYRIQVNNYSIFYVVIDGVVEVRRMIHNRRDLDHFIH